MKVLTDDQPIASGFFGQGKWLTDYITPETLEIQDLYQQLTKDVPTLEDRLTNLWSWVAEIKYKPFVHGKIWIDGKVSKQPDLWMEPSLTRRVKVGNCANKAFLLASLVRNELPVENVSCVLGNLYNGKPGGHAWVQVNITGQDYIMESTSKEAPLVLAQNATRYESIHYFNDQNVYTVPGKTVLYPFTRCFSSWLRDYLDWTYIEGGGSK